jgi:DNA topoisomerase IA
MPKRYRPGGKKRPPQRFGEASLINWLEFMGIKDAKEKVEKWQSRRPPKKEKPEDNWFPQ